MLAEEETSKKSRAERKAIKGFTSKFSDNVTEVKRSIIHDFRQDRARYKKIILTVIQRQHKLLNIIVIAIRGQEDVQRELETIGARKKGRVREEEQGKCI